MTSASESWRSSLSKRNVFVVLGLVVFTVCITLLFSAEQVFFYPKSPGPQFSSPQPAECRPVSNPSTNASQCEYGLPRIAYNEAAYVFYATNQQYLCNVLINVKRLRTVAQTEYDIVLIVPKAWRSDIEHVETLRSSSSPEKEQLHGLRYLIDQLFEFRAKFHIVELLVQDHGDHTWRESITKLRIYELTDYKRVIYFDSDGLVRRNMDHLFYLPSSPAAMVRAHWLTQPFFTDMMAVVEPSKERLDQLVELVKTDGGFDMDVMNTLFKSMAMALPSRYCMITGEMRLPSHEGYLGNKIDKWDPVEELSKAYYLHFSDFPLPKPWIQAPKNNMEKIAPKVEPEKSLWYKFYETFKEEMEICRM